MMMEPSTGCYSGLDDYLTGPFLPGVTGPPRLAEVGDTEARAQYRRPLSNPRQQPGVQQPFYFSREDKVMPWDEGLRRLQDQLVYRCWDSTECPGKVLLSPTMAFGPRHAFQLMCGVCKVSGLTFIHHSAVTGKPRQIFIIPTLKNREQGSQEPCRCHLPHLPSLRS